MSGTDHYFLGARGVMQVKCELMKRGWNVGSPEIDFGEDIFAIRDANLETARVQVKTSRATQREYGYSAQYRVDRRFLEGAAESGFVFVWAVHPGEEWGPFLVIGQPQLQRLVQEERMGSESESGWTFYVRYHADQRDVGPVECSDSELTQWLDDFSRWE